MRLLIATTNRDKLREINSLLAGAPVTVLGLSDFPPVTEPEETGATFEENARLKAFYYDWHLGGALRLHDPSGLTIAEDSGLVVDSLGGEPGIRSARFVRPDASYAERFDEIYRRLAARKDQLRRARFVCALVAVRDASVVFETTGVIEGTIAERPAGQAGFGYDPIFYYPPYGHTLAEVSEEEKLRVAHRGEAFRHFRRWLEGAKNGER